MNRPLRVCHLAYTFYEADNRVIRYAEAFAERGHQVEVIALRRPGQARQGDARGVRVFRIQRRSVTERRSWTYLAKILWFFIQSAVLLSLLQLRRRYDIVHVHNVPDFLVFAAAVPKLMGSRIILDIHDILPELYAGKFGTAHRSGLLRCLLLTERLSCAFANHVVVSNHLWEDKLVQRAVPAGKCTTIMNYPDLRMFRPLPESKKRRDGKFIILYPGTLNYHQGLDIAVKAFAKVADRMPNAELHIYGEGPARPDLVRLTLECGLGDRVTIADRVPLGEIAEIMASADVGVVPKRADGFGNEAFSTKILEFMACGVPVIVSRTQIDAHYFDHTLVRFFEPGDEADLAEALVEVYEHQSDRHARIPTAQDYAARNSWQARIGDYQHLVERLVDRSRHPEPIAS